MFRLVNAGVGANHCTWAMKYHPWKDACRTGDSLREVINHDHGPISGARSCISCYQYPAMACGVYKKHELYDVS